MNLMARIGANLRAGSLCGHGQLGYNPVESALKNFSDEFLAQMSGNGVIPIAPFVGPLTTRRGAQANGATPTATVKLDFVVKLEPAALSIAAPEVD
jgi:hypothetical protein